MPWYSQLATGLASFQSEFSNYSPPYLYLLWLVTLMRTMLPEMVGIKLIPILFDIGNAFWVYKILRVKYPQGRVPLLGAASFFVLPTIILNGAWWGQSDSIFTFFCLGCFYFLTLERPTTAMIFFGLAFSVKLQAIFLAPFLFLLLLKGHIKWTHGLVIPLIYFLIILPIVLAGRPLLDTLTIYLGQTDDFHALTLNAPNLYFFIPDAWYTPVLYIGLAGSALLALTWPIAAARKIKTLTPELMLLCATISAFAMPFLLPKMHERYFYLADVFLFLLAFRQPRLWPLPLLAQIVSTLTYSAYLFFPPASNTDRLILNPALIVPAALVNTVLAALLFREGQRLLQPHDQPSPIH
jgi:Gpi18-like mannosyltransferase